MLKNNSEKGNSKRHLGDMSTGNVCNDPVDPVDEPSLLAEFCTETSLCWVMFCRSISTLQEILTTWFKTQWQSYPTASQQQCVWSCSPHVCAPPQPGQTQLSLANKIFILLVNLVKQRNLNGLSPPRTERFQVISVLIVQFNLQAVTRLGWGVCLPQRKYIHDNRKQVHSVSWRFYRGNGLERKCAKQPGITAGTRDKLKEKTSLKTSGVWPLCSPDMFYFHKRKSLYDETHLL